MLSLKLMYHIYFVFCYTNDVQQLKDTHKQNQNERWPYIASKSDKNVDCKQVLEIIS